MNEHTTSPHTRGEDIITNRELKISTAGSRYETLWANKLISWEELQERLKHSREHYATAEQYHGMTKSQQGEAKDGGGFVGGHLANGRRRKGNILSRSLIALDLDTPSLDLLTELPDLLPAEWVVYSTHSHTADKPRYRLILPLTRDVSEDEYSAVGRRLAADVGIDMFDDSTYQAHRLMFWPSHPQDVEPVYKHNTGAWVDPDAVLARFDDWKDVSTWPTSSRQSHAITTRAERQADPLDKPGLIGAFCRAHTIHDAIHEFLPKIYEEAKLPGRYTYIPGETQAGVVTYDDKFAFSHHGTDPAGDQLLNAFDLVRVHLYGAEDAGAKAKTPPHKMPSFQRMSELARTDYKTRVVLDHEAEQQALEEFGDIPQLELNQGDNSDNTSNTESAEKDSKEGEPGNWRTKAGLERNHKGGYDDTLDNLTKILTHDPRLQAICYNQLAGVIDVRNPKALPWKQSKPGWSDADTAQLKLYLEKSFNLYSGMKTGEALQIAAASRAYHPIKDYLGGLPAWDGTQRVDTLLTDYLGAADTPYTRAVIRKTLVAAVKRIYRPGCKFDTVLILNGPQGTGKSTLFAKLGGAWFSDALSLTDMRDKTGAEKLQAYWILELGELAGMRKMEVEIIKGFLSRTDDKFRAAYARTVESHPRQCVIVGTTNAESGFLRDTTGNRRFWPVMVTGESKKKTWEMTSEVVGQIWAEALLLYREGESVYLSGELAEQARAEQDASIETDDRVGLVEEYLETKLPDNWEQMGVRERRAYLTTGDGDFEGLGASPVRGARRREVSNVEIWAECFGREPADMKPADSYAISAIMQKLPEWEKTGKLARLFPYGKQRVYEWKMGDNPPF